MTRKTVKKTGPVINCAHDKLVDIDLLVPHPKNPNTHPENQIKFLAKILKHQGWRAPVTVSNRSGYVCAGHGRIEAARLNGWTTVPVDYQDFKNEADEYAHLVADNKIQELSELDNEKIEDIFKDIPADFDKELFGGDSSTFIMPDFEPGSEEEQGKLDELKPVMTQCPNCGECFDAKENKPQD